MQRALFRADATPQLGGGHIYRCLTLAHALAAEDWTCSFACNEGAEGVVPWLARSPFRRVDPNAPRPEPVDLLVVDHYDLAADYESACRSWAKQILVIDDLANRRHDADMLIDQNVGRQSADYVAIVPRHCRLLIGPAFALLRPAFGRRRLAGWRQRRDVRRVLVAMGATDPANATSVALSGLADVPDLAIDVVLGAAATHLNSVRDQVRALGDRCRVLVDVDDDAIAALIDVADLAIAAAGGSAWERCCLGLPTLLVILADNQRSAADHLHAVGAVRLLGAHPGLTAADVAAAVRALIDDPATVAKLSRVAAGVCDGLGARRVAGSVMPERCEDDGEVVLRPAIGADSETILAWNRIPSVRRHFHNPNPPTADEHAAWFAASLHDPERMLNMIEFDRQPVGVLRLDRIGKVGESARDGFLVSILVDPKFEGRGVGKAALRAARRLMAGQRLVAEVMDANVASRRAFEASGYHRHDGLYVNGCH
jgi:UDP-2,4-diacetamido-2,4,6-trideoxy-beta-L-altropyranose hydrolase